MTERSSRLSVTLTLHWGNDAAAVETVTDETVTGETELSETRTETEIKTESTPPSVIEIAPPAPAANTVTDEPRKRTAAVRQKSSARERLLPSERMILDYLRENLETDDTTCYVKLRDIAAVCGMHWRSVQDALRRLEARRLVAQLKQQPGLHAGCRYRLLPLPARHNLFPITARQRS